MKTRITGWAGVFVFLLTTTDLAFSQNSETPNESKLTLNAFLDFGFDISNRDSIGKRGSFDLHHFNILSTYIISERVKAFGEVEWEHGPQIEGENGAVEGVGTVALERGWLEYRFSNACQMRFGKFVTPFGLYNRVHDQAPAFTTVVLPSSIYGRHPNGAGQDQRLYPKYGGGVMVLGHLPRGTLSIQYRVYLSNGRGSSPFEQDDNNNKGLGGRMLVNSSSNHASMGFSFYGDRNNENGLNAFERTYASDFHLGFSGLTLESELAWYHLETGNGTGRFVNRRGGYLQAEYELTGSVTPVVRFDLFDRQMGIRRDLEAELTTGVNIELQPAVFLKSEVHFFSFQNPAQKPYQQWLAGIAAAF